MFCPRSWLVGLGGSGHFSGVGFSFAVGVVHIVAFCWIWFWCVSVVILCVLFFYIGACLRGFVVFSVSEGV